jgi:chromosome segregation ATPase
MNEAHVEEHLAKLQTHLGTLTAAIKAKTSELKQISEEVSLAQAKARMTIREVQEQQAARLEELRQQSAPLEEAVAASTKRLQEQDIIHNQRMREHHEEMGRVRHKKMAALETLDAQIAAQTARLEVMHQAVAECQRKVAAF